MSSSKEGSSSGSHSQQQHPHSLQHRKAFGIDDLDQNRHRTLNDRGGKAAHAPSSSDLESTLFMTPNPSDHVNVVQPITTSTINQSHSTAPDPTQSVAQEKPLTRNPSSPAETQSTASPPRTSHSDRLSISDLAFLALAFSPALLHLWGRSFARTSTPRLFGTWFALLTLPFSVPLYRWQKLPRLALDMLELVSYGSVFTITVDITAVLYVNMVEYPPTSEWEWLIFYPAVAAAVACWLVVVGILWALVVV